MAKTRFDRLELKFLINAEQRRRVEAGLRERLQPDPHGDVDGRYPVVTLYFDNAARDTYLDSLRGLPFRRKLRLRVYGTEDGPAGTASFIEVKHKSGKRSVKRRVQMSVDEALALGRGGPAWERNGHGALEASFAEEAERMVSDLELEPLMVLRYDRQAFRGTGKESDLRVTLDTDLRARARDLRPSPDDQDFDLEMLEPGQSIMEIKVDRVVPFWLARLVGEAGCVRQAHSKFRRSVQALGLQPQAVSPVRRLTWQADPERAALMTGEATWTS